MRAPLLQLLIGREKTAWAARCIGHVVSAGSFPRQSARTAHDSSFRSPSSCAWLIGTITGETPAWRECGCVTLLTPWIYAFPFPRVSAQQLGEAAAQHDATQHTRLPHSKFGTCFPGQSSNVSTHTRASPFAGDPSGQPGGARLTPTRVFFTLPLPLIFSCDCFSCSNTCPALTRASGWAGLDLFWGCTRMVTGTHGDAPPESPCACSDGPRY